MNKTDLVNEVAEIVGSKNGAKAAVDSIFEAITRALKNSETVSVPGFGTFKVEDRKARTGRNPQTGEMIDIKARKVPKFTPGKSLKEAVN
ncbi:MAG: HU family DNA-binding protein [Desulfatiglandales bacterium]